MTEIWSMPHSWRPQYIFSNIGYCFKAVKWSMQRVKRGWADCDVWNLRSNILNYLNETIQYLADNHYGFPGHGRFDTDEKWTKYLNDMAACFYRAQEENNCYDHEAFDKWWNWVEEHDYVGKLHGDENPYSKEMFDETIRNGHKQNNDMIKGLQMLMNVFWELWD